MGIIAINLPIFFFFFFVFAVTDQLTQFYESKCDRERNISMGLKRKTKLMKKKKDVTMSKLFYAINLFIEQCTLLRLAKLFESITWSIFYSEFLIIGTERQLSKVSVDKIKIGQAEVSPVSSVRNLGTWFDSHLDMLTHVSKTCASAFYYLYSIRDIRKYLSRESTERLVHAFITSRLDYCNGLLYGALEYQIKNLQRVMDASARLVYCTPKYCHVTPLLRELHWLPVRLRIDFKILLVTLKIPHGVAPSYLKDLVSVLPDSCYQLRRNNNGILLERPRLRTKKTLGDRALSVAAPFLWNSLPLPIRQETSIDSFKRSVKTYLFKKAFN